MLKYFFAISFCLLATSGTAQPDIELRVNLQGYPADAPKKVLILSRKALKTPQLDLISASNQKVIATFTCKKSETAWEPFPFTYEIDFSPLNQIGKYYFQLKNYR